MTSLPLDSDLDNDADLSPDGSLIVTASQNGAARIWTRDG